MLRKTRGSFRGLRSFHSKARRILEDFPRKVGEWVVDIVKLYKGVRLEDLKNLAKHVDKLSKEFSTLPDGVHKYPLLVRVAS
ncbi:hypothetical protein HS1genome_1261 [Sulfodiicoccus acidiphilus]|uniref:Uncharacterized protein n=1 Tax=Sulfodiicoccus acidiphilus TaxID=1670455 RepID=A0A348B3X0_9CREN|nr:hypothetical protein HS1genome_1261 [Sulfodiicoccus acidiphilus]GGT88339.1 hypothetical protein GCM10007116_02910 [Sulfodiicoccus acidiphilus]